MRQTDGLSFAELEELRKRSRPVTRFGSCPEPDSRPRLPPRRRISGPIGPLAGAGRSTRTSPAASSSSRSPSKTARPRGTSQQLTVTACCGGKSRSGITRGTCMGDFRSSAKIGFARRSTAWTTPSFFDRLRRSATGGGQATAGRRSDRDKSVIRRFNMSDSPFIGKPQRAAAAMNGCGGCSAT